MKHFLLLILLAGCASKVTQDEPPLTSVQVMDRNGFAETVSSKDRLVTFNQIDFTSPQPYQKVLRVYNKDKTGKTKSIITSYHDNGLIWQSLEVVDGRAHGNYKEWHANGKTKLEASIIEGVADLHETAQTSWIFEGLSNVWDEEGNKIAEIPYEKGVLQGISHYYYADGTLWKEVPLYNGEINGTLIVYAKDRTILEKCTFENGLLQSAEFLNQVSEIKNGKGFYASFENGQLKSLTEYQNGAPCGLVKIFDPSGNLSSTYRIADGKKEGEEIIYHDSHPSQPKISLEWHDDLLQGQIKTWYLNGVLESQREINGNKKEGSSFAWYKDASLMLIEEYEKDQLVKGSYYKKKDKKPVSTIENGKGTATLYDGDGILLKKVPYEKGKPLLDQR